MFRRRALRANMVNREIAAMVEASQAISADHAWRAAHDLYCLAVHTTPTSKRIHEQQCIKDYDKWWREYRRTYGSPDLPR